MLTRAKTLFYLDPDPPPVEELARSLGAAAVGRTKNPDGLRLKFPDGDLAMVNFWRWTRPQDFVSSSLLATAQLLRDRRVPAKDDQRRDRILARLQNSRGIMVVGSQKGLTPDMIELVKTLADRTDALLWDPQEGTLSSANGRKLVDRKGFVTEDVPGDAPHLPAPPPRPAPATHWTDKPYVLSWEDPKAVHSALGSTKAKVLDESTDRKATELADRILDLRAKVISLRLPQKAKERRAKVLFAIMSSKVLIDLGGTGGGDGKRDLNGIARRVHGIVLSETEILDEAGRLVLSTSGAFEPRALSPRRLWLFADGPSPEELRDAGKRLNIEEAEIDVVDLGRGGRDEILERELAAFDSVKKVREGGHRRAMLEGYIQSPAVLRVVGSAPLELDQIANVERVAHDLHAVIFDGWGFYDPDGRAIVLRNGMFDPAASVRRMRADDS